MKTMMECPRFDCCSANRCPLDPAWPTRPQLSGEPVCFYLREAVKESAEARFAARDDFDVYQAACRMLSEDVGSVIRSRLKEAARTGSKIDGARHFGARHEGNVLLWYMG